jgi:hypothetical protein
LVSHIKGRIWIEDVWKQGAELNIGPWRKVVDWRRSNNKELNHNLYASPNITWVIKSRSMRWAVHLPHIGEMRNTCNILVGKTEGRSPLWKTVCDGKIILQWSLEK